MAFYGDCVVAAWPPGFSGEDHAQKAQQTAIELARDKNMIDSKGERIPVGVGVHTGKVYTWHGYRARRFVLEMSQYLAARLI